MSEAIYISAIWFATAIIAVFFLSHSLHSRLRRLEELTREIDRKHDVIHEAGRLQASLARHFETDLSRLENRVDRLEETPRGGPYR